MKEELLNCLSYHSTIVTVTLTIVTIMTSGNIEKVKRSIKTPYLSKIGVLSEHPKNPHKLHNHLVMASVNSVTSQIAPC